MKRRDFLKAAGFGAAAFAVPGCAYARRGRAKKPNKPNIIYIMLDELGYFELSCMGNKYLKTPNIDRMATEGIRFTQALAGGAVCAPTRGVFLTGLHAGHTTVRRNSQNWPMRAEDVTIGEVLKKAGYATGGFGKWGCGDRGTTGVPEMHGFDLFFGYYNQVHAHSYYPNYLIRNSEKVPLEGNTGDYYKGKQYAHYLIFEESIKFIRENRDRAFFCYCPWTPPHGLWGIPEDDPAWQDYKDKPWTAGQRTPNDAKVYAAMVKMIDRQVGEILALLKELGIDENTIVFVSGDNGGQPYFLNGDPSKPRPKEPPYPHGFFGPNLNPHTGVRFRGGKGNLYEGGLRIPMIVRWPGKIKPGRVSDHLWYFPDVMPTLAELAGAKPPDNIDGISIVPTLLGEKTAARNQKNHKFLYWEHGSQVAVRTGAFKAIRPGKNRPFELYDLSKDPGELNNIAAEHPDLLAKMTEYAAQSHTENLVGKVLDKEKRFMGHKAK
ncbi:MAG: arylsulfatase [Planctomycetes bacterium]|nr:arylsulfatase [Planctomycetota bacterium]